MMWFARAIQRGGVDQAPVAQLDRAPDFESGGQGFESLPARHLVLVCEHQSAPDRLARTARSSSSLLPLMRIWRSSTSITSINECRYALRKGTEPLPKLSRMSLPKRSIRVGSRST